MEHLVLYDKGDWRKHLLPLVATRPISDLRIGIWTIAEKWRNLLVDVKLSYLTVDYLQLKYAKSEALSGRFTIVKGGVLPNQDLLHELNQLRVGQVLTHEGTWIGCVTKDAAFDESMLEKFDEVQSISSPVCIQYSEDIFLQNHGQISADFQTILRRKNIKNTAFLAEDDINLDGVSIVTESGPVYVGKGAVIEPGVFIKGPVAIGDYVRIKAGARLYPNVTIGPHSVVCGEINNTVIWGNSAKGHDGYLGCAVIGEGCNLGAGTSNSNLRNDWKTVKLYDYLHQDFRDTKLLKCGLIMGDMAMVGIHSSFTTGTVIGVGAQIAYSLFLPKFIPDFIWLTDQKKVAYYLDAFLDMQKRISLIKNNVINPADSCIFEHCYENTIDIRDNFIQSK